MKYLFNPETDLERVDQVGYLNIGEAFKNGSISGDFAFTDEEYNRASPADLMHRPDDVFAGYRQRDYIKSSLAAQAQAERVNS